MEEMTQEPGSQTVVSQPSDAQNDDLRSAYAAFGLDTPTEQEDASNDEPESDTDEDAPAIEQPEPTKILKVKHNKEDVEIPEEQVPELVQKGLALDKIRSQRTEYEKSLDRVAKLQGFKDHADLVANLDRLEQEAQQRQQAQHDNLRQQMREQAEEAGLDPQTVDQWLDNHPLLQEANRAIQERQQAQEQQRQQEQAQLSQQKWVQLYEAYPHLIEQSKVLEEGGTPEFMTPEMQARLERGYDPLDAFELAHKSTLTAQAKKAAEQRAIKEQQLGLRSRSETHAPADLEPSVPQHMADAFAAFGLDPKAAKKYVKAR